MTAEPFTGWFSTDHRACDQLFAEGEAAMLRGDWNRCRQAVRRFGEALERHFRLEETILFPAYESASGAPGGPTEVMRGEHAQMRPLIAALAGAAAEADPRAFRDAFETLLLFMQQHNLKEETVLYPLCDRVLAGQRARLLEALARETGT
ncbi:MAG: hemerythrin domain-containing protein [Pseudomonadota bacterium]